MRVLLSGGLGWTVFSIVAALKTVGHDIHVLRLAGFSRLVDLVGKFDTVALGELRSTMTSMQQPRTLRLSSIYLWPLILNPYVAPVVPFRVYVRGTYNVFESAKRRQIDKDLLQKVRMAQLTFTAINGIGPALLTSINRLKRRTASKCPEGQWN